MDDIKISNIQTAELRRDSRSALNRVEHGGEHLLVSRYNEPAAVLVPYEWWLAHCPEAAAQAAAAAR